MTSWLARHALRLYPLAYQRRYGDEMRALLEDRPPHARAVLDLLRGALLAHLRPSDAPAGAVAPADRVRATASGVLMCWVFFAAAGFGYYKTTEDQPFSLAGAAHPLLRDAHLAVQAVAIVASASVVLGALPLIASALAHARHGAVPRRKVVVPFLPLIVFAAVSAAGLAVARAQPPHGGTTAGHGMAIVWGIAALACGATCVWACRSVLFAIPAQPAHLRVALISGTFVTLAMFAIAGATALYAIALSIDAAGLAAEANGPFHLVSVSASLTVQTIVMAAASVLAAVTTRRGWRVKDQLTGS